jgi:hypothetical protein
MARRVSFCESSSKLPSKSVADNPRSPLPLLSQINISPLKVTSPVSQQILKLDCNEIANSGESFSNLHLNQFPDVTRYHARSLSSSNFKSLRFSITSASCTFISPELNLAQIILITKPPRKSTNLHASQSTSIFISHNPDLSNISSSSIATVDFLTFGNWF